MKKLGISVLGVAMAAAMALPVFAKDPVKVTGELVDVMCGTKKPASHNEACAGACAKRGEPVAVFAKDGMYTITGKLTADKNAKLLEFMAKNVTVTGEVTKDKDGKMSIAAESIVVAK
jgi:hypothetical protein